MQTGMSDDLENVTDAPKTSIIDRELERLNIDIVGLQETRLAGFGSTKEKNYTFFWQGLQEEEKRIHGVGFAIRNKLLPMMEPPKQGSERIFSIRLQTSSGFTTFVCCYAPTLSAEVDQKDQFYAQLDDTINKIPSSDDLYLLGDFNARVGAEKCLWPEVLGAHGIGRMNENGQRLLEFCSHHHLCITNTFFECKPIHKGTWRHPRSKTWHQIDFTITKQSNLHNVKNSRTYHSADCNTDHSLVRSKIKFVPKAIYKPKKNGPPKIDISKAKCKKWKFKFHEKFNTTYQPVEDDQTTATTAWNYLKDTIHSCALETFGTKKRRNKDWYEANAEVIEPFLERKRNAMLKLKIDPNQSNKIEHQRLRNEAQRAARKCANEYYTNLAEKIQRASDTGNIRAMYEGINEAIGKQIKKPAPLKSKTGELLTDNKKKLERLVEHYVDLYSTNTSVSDKALEFFPQSSAFLFLDDEPTFQDVAEAIDCQQCGKAPGQDGISPDIIKCGKEALIEPLHAILCKCWEEGSVPQDMRDAKIITLYKNKGDRSDCNNYRGISLLSIVGKIFARVILSRLQFLGTLVYPEAQCGFRPQRSTIDMIFATRQIQEKCREQQMPLFIAFIDLTKAFDLVSREGLFKVLKKIGCPEKLLSIIISFHKSMTGVVSFDGEVSSSFPIANGVGRPLQLRKKYRLFDPPDVPPDVHDAQGARGQGARADGGRPGRRMPRAHLLAPEARRRPGRLLGPRRPHGEPRLRVRPLVQLARRPGLRRRRAPLPGLHRLRSRVHGRGPRRWLRASRLRGVLQRRPAGPRREDRAARGLHARHVPWRRRGGPLLGRLPLSPRGDARRLALLLRRRVRRHRRLGRPAAGDGRPLLRPLPHGRLGLRGRRPRARSPREPGPGDAPRAVPPRARHGGHGRAL